MIITGTVFVMPDTAKENQEDDFGIIRQAVRAGYNDGFREACKLCVGDYTRQVENVKREQYRKGYNTACKDISERLALMQIGNLANGGDKNVSE